MDAQNVFECGRVCAVVANDLEWAVLMITMLAMPVVMIGWETKLVRWLRVQAGKVMDY